MKEILEANLNRNKDHYLKMMDKALLNKLELILGKFAYINDGMRIVDSGASSCTLLNAIANIINDNYRNVDYFATDISMEYLSKQNERSAVQAIVADSVEQIFCKNSIDIKYFSSILHEIFSFSGGNESIRRTLKNTYLELKSGGQILIRDFVKPPHQTIYMEVFDEYDKFIRFHNEFGNGNEFEFEIVEVELNSKKKKLIKLDSEWAYEFYMRKEYTINWDSEIKEKYSYFTLEQMKSELENIGYKDVVIKEEHNNYIYQNWLKDKINLYILEESSTTFIQHDFPATHMIVSARKL